MGNFNEEIFFKNLGLADGRQRFNGMVDRLSSRYTRNQLQELSWLENRGRSHVDSPVGAMGFPQIMPDTLKGLQRNNPNRGYTDPRDPGQAILMMEDLLRENYDYYQNKGVPHEVASRKGVRSYHGGYNEENWGSANRHYDAIVNGGGVNGSGTGAIAQNQLQRPPGNIDMIAAYNQGLPQRQSQAQNAQPQTADHSVSLDTMLPFQGIVDKTAKYSGEPYYSAFQRYSNPDFKG